MIVLRVVLWTVFGPLVLALALVTFVLAMATFTVGALSAFFSALASAADDY
jgi:hypothetical protein